MSVATIAQPILKPPAFAPRTRETEVIVYPESDGKPMAENDPQYRCITDTRFALGQFFRDDANVYLGADMLVYYEEGDPTKSVAPDVFVVFGAPKGIRSNYQIWREGKAPDVVFEFASPGTWRADLGWKMGLYQGLGVREYLLFDPLDAYFSPLLQGYRLTGRRYEAIPTLRGERGRLGVRSEALSLEIWAQPHHEPGMPFVLRLFHPQHQTWLRTPDEEADARREAERQVADLAAEIERLRAQLSGAA